MKAALVIVAVTLFVPPAVAQNAKQKNVIEKYAAASALAKLCPSWKVNNALVAAGFLAFNMHPRDVSPGGRFSAFLEEQNAELRETLEGQPESTVCATALVLYGPEGINAPDLLIRR